MTLETRVGKSLLKNMSEQKYRHKVDNGKSCEGREKNGMGKGKKEPIDRPSIMGDGDT